ncbi:MAG: hypothetical protein IAI50_08970 [Candidatus Eremiobacteraeota bacterium]|nr:hypothetical protein [Candidatus Eremiobacteraeota bacterium]
MAFRVRDRPRRWLGTRLVPLLLAAATVASAPSRAGADDAPIPLANLEQLLAGAPSLRAAQRRIDADLDFEGVVQSRSGLEYTYTNAVGPRSDIIINNVNNNTFRYQQRVGIQLPILGSAITQQNDAIVARTDELLARIAYEQERRQRLSALRAAYVLYWQYDFQQSIAERYANLLNAKLEAARGLRRNGFWTQGQFLDFLDTLSRYKTDEQTLRSSRRAQLTLIASSLGAELSSFRPLDPTFETGCIPTHDSALAAAEAIDSQLATTQAQIAQIDAELAHVRGSSIDAHAIAGLGNVVDFVNPAVGYELTAGVQVSLPTHARSEERSMRNQLDAQRDEQRLLAEQRRSDLSAQVEGAIDELSNARADLKVAIQEQQARLEDLREAVVRFNTINATGAGAFDEIEIDSAEAFTAETAVATARGTVYTKANALLLLAPAACT